MDCSAVSCYGKRALHEKTCPRHKGFESKLVTPHKIATFMRATNLLFIILIQLYNRPIAITKINTIYNKQENQGGPKSCFITYLDNFVWINHRDDKFYLLILSLFMPMNRTIVVQGRQKIIPNIINNFRFHLQCNNIFQANMFLPQI